MTKQEQINVSTEEEIEERNKKGKEKDELKQALLHYATAEASGGIKSLIDCEGCASYLYENLGYRKLPKDSVIIDQEEWATLHEDYAKALYEKEKQSSKETAEKIFKELYMHFSVDKLCGIANPNKNYNSAKVVSRLAKQFKVEIKE